MKIFEYLFFILYKWNIEFVKEKDVPIFYSILGVSIFQTLNIIAIYNYFHLYVFEFSKKIKDNTFLIIGGIIFIVFYLYFHSNKKYITILNNIYKSYLWNFLTVLYIALSIFLYIISLQIAREQNIFNSIN